MSRHSRRLAGWKDSTECEMLRQPSHQELESESERGDINSSANTIALWHRVFNSLCGFYHSMYGYASPEDYRAVPRNISATVLCAFCLQLELEQRIWRSQFIKLCLSLANPYLLRSQGKPSPLVDSWVACATIGRRYSSNYYKVASSLWKVYAEPFGVNFIFDHRLPGVVLPVA